jgi:hypothetical protein
MANSTTFQQIWTRFNANIGALWVFSQQIGGLADERDKTQVSEWTCKLAEVFGMDAAEVERDYIEAFQGEEDSETEAVSEQIKELADDLKALNSDESRRKIEEWEEQNPQKVHELYALLRAAFTQPAAQGNILRRGALVLLVSFFETLESDLIHFHFSRYPGALPKPEERSINLAELRELGDIDEVERYLADKEVADILRGSLPKQLKYFEKLRIDLKPLSDDCRDELIEIDQRRNLLVHNDGIVNKIYLTRTPESRLRDKKVEIGCQLSVSHKYLSRAIETVHLFGFILIQLCWRHWIKDEQDEADKVFIELTYDSLVQGKYDFVKRLAGFAPIARVSKAIARRIAINHAIALRELGEKDEIRKAVKGCDWLPQEIEVQIALCTLREEYERVYSLLAKAAETGEIKRMWIDWPLFRPIRNEQRFIEIFQQGFDLTDR